MTTALYIALALSQVGLLVYYFFFSNKKKNQEAERRAALSREFPYEVMRSMALNVNPGAMLAAIPDGTEEVYAMIMDWDMGNDVVTLSAQVTGEVNLYVQSGGGIIGAGKHLNVSTAAQQFTHAAKQYLGEAKAGNDTALPPKNNVKFIFLTNKGRYTATEDYSKIENGSSSWAPLFQSASLVINEMRNTPR